jgi:hypothetical protein
MEVFDALMTTLALRGGCMSSLDKQGILLGFVRTKG